MNRKLNMLIQILGIALLSSILSGCLEDSDYENGINGIKPGNNNFVEVHLTSSDATNTVSRSYDATAKDTTINLIPINLTSGPATSDVTVSIELLDTANSTTMKSYVEDDGYVVPDTNKFVITNPGKKVFIRKGSSTGYIQVKFVPNDFVGNTFIFGIKIKTISDSKYQISNLTTGFVKFGIKNKYDGNYTLTGTMIDYMSGTITGAYPINVYLITQDGSSNALFDVDEYNDYYHLIKSGSNFSIYGEFSPVFKFDSNDNVIEVTNYYGQPSETRARAAVIDPTGINKYDKNTKTLKVSYWMTQGGVNRTHFEETFEYMNPR